MLIATYNYFRDQILKASGTVQSSRKKAWEEWVFGSSWPIQLANVTQIAKKLLGQLSKQSVTDGRGLNFTILYVFKQKQDAFME